MALTLVGRLPTLSFGASAQLSEVGVNRVQRPPAGPAFQCSVSSSPVTLDLAASPFPGSVPPQTPTTQNTVHRPWMSLLHRGRCQPHPVLGLGHWSWRGAPGRGLGVARLAPSWRSPGGDVSSLEGQRNWLRGPWDWGVG